MHRLGGGSNHPKRMSVVGTSVMPTCDVVAVATVNEIILVSFRGETTTTSFARNVGAIASVANKLTMATTDGRVVQTEMGIGTAKKPTTTWFPDVEHEPVTGLDVSSSGNNVVVAWENTCGAWVRVGNGPWRRVHMHHVPRLVCVSETTVVSISDLEMCVDALGPNKKPIPKPEWLLADMALANDENQSWVGATRDGHLMSNCGTVLTSKKVVRVAISPDAGVVAVAFSDGEFQIMGKRAAVFNYAVVGIDIKQTADTYVVAATDGIDVLAWEMEMDGGAA